MSESWSPKPAHKLSRRWFMRAGAAGVGAAAMPSLSALSSDSPASTVAQADVRPDQVLSTRALEIRFDRHTGLPSGYQVRSLAQQVLGAEKQELRRPQWQYQGGRNSGEYERDIHVTTIDGAFFEFTFTGTGVEYVTDKNSDKGKLDMFLDGVFSETVDAYAPARTWQASVFTRTGLTAGEHVLRGVKRDGEYAIVDAFKVHSGDGVTTVNDTGTAVNYSAEPGYRNNLGAVVTDKAHQSEVPAVVSLLRITLAGCRAVVSYVADVGTATAATFALHYAVSGESLQISLEDVREHSGWELVEVHSPSLVTVTSEETGAWLAHGDGGGVWAPLSAALVSSMPYGARGSFPNLSILPLVLLGKQGVAVAAEVQGYLSNTAINVYTSGAKKLATVGAVTMHRVPATATPSLLVEQKEVLRLDFVGDVDGSGSVDWLDAAKVVKNRVPKNPTDYYDDKFLYALQGQVGPTNRTDPACTFAEAEVLIRRVSSLLDGNPQVVFMAGWPEGGHDTSYPAVSKVNPELGGKAGFDRLQTHARTLHNTNVTLDDNWDDQYKNSYTQGVFDARYIEVTADGALERQAAWNGVDTSYITGFAKYMVAGGPGMKRARFTIDHYNLKDGVLIDAMSWWSIRNDWDPRHPASAVENLRDGKFKVIEEYAKRGVHIGSELLRYPFVGRLAFTMDGPTGGGWNGFGGSAIPLLALVLRDSTTYGIDSGSSPTPRTSLFHNNRVHTWLDKATPDAAITDLYYLSYLPWMIFHGLAVKTFTRADGIATIGFGHGTSIVIDDDAATQQAVHRGVQVMNGDSVTIPVDSRRIAFYSRTAETLSYPLPRGTDPSKLRARLLTGTEQVAHPVAVKNGVISVAVPVQTPVIVTTSTTK